MKLLLTISLTALFAVSHGQGLTNITGKVVDENGKAVSRASVRYGDDTAYTDLKGQFNINYPNPHQNWYYLYFERKDFLPKAVFIDLSAKDLVLNTPIVLRSREGFWYDPKQIDSTHIGMTVKEAIATYKLDIDMCELWDEPPGAYHHFTTELSDSSEICIVFPGIFNMKKRLTMTDILDRRITGIGIAFTDGTEKIVGNGFTHRNPYLIGQ